MSGAALAGELGTSLPRVARAAKRLGIDSRPGGRLSLAVGDVRRLRAELGVTPRVEGLAPIEVKVLAALRRAPFGLISARSVAARAAVSPTAASRALNCLEERMLVYREQTMIAAGRARPAVLWHANLLHPRWSEIARALGELRPPKQRSRRETQAGRVPVRLGHLFWNVSPAQLDTNRAGSFIAGRLLSTQDAEGLAWGAIHLRPTDWRAAAKARGLDPRTRALAENLARGTGR